MEASQAGLSGDAGQAQGEGQGEAQEGQQQSPDMNQLLQEQLGPLAQNMEQMRDFLQSEPWKPEAEPEPEADPYAYEQTGDPEYDAQQEALAEWARNLTGPLQDQIKQQQQVLDQQQERWIEYEANRLADEFPELRDEKNAEQVIIASRHLAEQFGQPGLANNPEFWRLTHMALSAQRAAAEEQQDAGDQPAHLEGGGGAGAGQTAPVNMLDQILNRNDDDGLGAGVLNFGS